MTSTTTLLLVDVQEDFLARPGLTPDRETLLASLAHLLAHARRNGWPVVHVHSREAMPHRRASPEVVAGTAGAEPPPEAAPAAGEALLFKRFFSAFDAEELDDILRSAGTKRLVIAGTHSHACIRDSVDDAYRRGYEVVIAAGGIASYDPAHAAAALDWMSGRAAQLIELEQLTGTAAPAPDWVQRDPCDQRRELQTVRLTPVTEVNEAAADLAARQAALEALGIHGRRERLIGWRERLQVARGDLLEALVRDVAKPQRDATSELDYGLALLDDVIATLADEQKGAPQVRYRPRGLAGLITPWNNPFAISVGKLAPALGYGNCVLWKPALPATRLSQLLTDLLGEAGLGDWLRMVPGGAGTGDALAGAAQVCAISFTGSVPVGRRLIARANARREPIPVQAELGGSNAAIIDESADLDSAANDLAAAMFSFSGQRCTAIRRIILMEPIAHDFTERLVAATKKLKVGLPDDPACDVGPLIDRSSQQRILDVAARAQADGGKLLCGGTVPSGLPEAGCWVEPTIIDGLDPDHPLNREEWFGPIASIARARDLDEAIALHNRSDFGLVGALYSTEEAHIERFVAQAQAGMLSIGRARPAFAASGPFSGWKASGYGAPEHGRWNRDFYTRAQAVYRD